MVDDLGGVGPDQGARCAKEGVEDVGLRPNFFLEVPSLLNNFEVDARSSHNLVSCRITTVESCYVRISSRYTVTNVILALKGGLKGHASSWACGVVPGVSKPVSCNEVVEGDADVEKVCVTFEVVTADLHARH